MKRVFVFEYLTGGGDIDGGDAALQTLLPLGLRMRDSMVGDLLAARSFDVTAAICARAPQLAPGVRPCVALAGETPLELVARQARTHDAVWVVAPETQGLLQAFCRAVPASRWLGCEAGAIALASSKRMTLARLAECGIATPLAFAAEANAWVVKPDDGAGAVDTALYRDRGAAQAAAAARAGMTIEPWVEGDAMSLSLLCAGGAADLLSVNRQQIEIDAAGRLAYRGVEPDRRRRSRATDETLADLAVRVARSIGGLRGFVGIDIVWHRQCGPVVIEVNPRVTCAYDGLSQRLSRNLAAEMLALQGA